MAAKRFRLTKAAKILIFLLVIALIGGGVFAGVKTGVIKTSKQNEKLPNKDNGNKNDGQQVASTTTPEPTKSVSNNTNDKNEVASKPTVTNTPKPAEPALDVMNLAIDEWVGYIPIVKGDAAGIYEKYGIDLNLYVINDSTQSSNAMIKGELDGAGYTINRVAFLSNKFKNAGVKIVMPYITNYSNGGDGLIALSSIKTINDLVGAKIGVPQFTESQAMLVWFVNQSGLSQKEKDDIINNLILFETADEAAKAFFAGRIDVAGTWQPYLTQAENMTDSHILFSTASSTKLIMSGIIFREDYATQNADVVSRFIDATLEASSLYSSNEYNKELSNMMPMFSGMSDEDIAGMTMDAKLTTWANNMDILKEDAKLIYTNMCKVWESIGETVDNSLVDTLFDNRYMAALSDKYETIVKEEPVEDNRVTVTEENKEEILNTTALLTKTSSVRFVTNTAKFAEPAVAANELDSFIEVAKMLDGAIIEIAGNTDPNPKSDPLDEYNIKLSWQRAEAVKNYFIMNGISADRIVTVGNGSSNPIVENDTEEHRAMNRRTDVSFKIIE